MSQTSQIDDQTTSNVEEENPEPLTWSIGTGSKKRGRPFGIHSSLSLVSRCAIAQFLQALDNIVNPSIKKKFLETPFKHFVEMMYPKKDTMLIEELITRYDTNRCGFQLGFQFFPFTAKDVCSILGLAENGNTLFGNPVQSRKSSRIYSLYLRKEPRVRVLLKRFNELASNKSLSRVEEEDAVRMLVLLLLSSFLFPKGDGNISNELFQAVEDIDGLHSWSWGTEVFKFLKDSLDESASRFRAKKKLGHLKGCCVLLSTWLLERVKIVPLLRPSASPLMNRWDYKHLVSGSLRTRRKSLSSLEECDFYEHEGPIVSGSIDVSVAEKNDHEESDSLVLEVSKQNVYLLGLEHEYIVKIMELENKLREKDEIIKGSNEKLKEKDDMIIELNAKVKALKEQVNGTGNAEGDVVL